MSMIKTAGPDRSPAGQAVPVIEAQEVTKQFGAGETLVQALRGVNLRAERGEMLAIMGPSGSGKSTLLGIISGLDTATSGRAEARDAMGGRQGTLRDWLARTDRRGKRGSRGGFAVSRACAC